MTGTLLMRVVSSTNRRAVRTLLSAARAEMRPSSGAPHESCKRCGDRATVLSVDTRPISMG